MKIFLFDIEADGFLEESTQVWCLSYTKLDDSSKGGLDLEIKTLAKDMLTTENIKEAISDCTHISGHNIIGYDLPMLAKYFPDLDLSRLEIIDTLVLSKLMYPDRPLPRGCPTSIKIPGTNRSRVIRSHGLEAWGYRVSVSKPEIHQWTEFTPEIIKRCEEDVSINTKTLFALLKEMKVQIRDILKLTYNIKT